MPTLGPTKGGLAIAAGPLRCIGPSDHNPTHHPDTGPFPCHRKPAPCHRWLSEIVGSFEINENLVRSLVHEQHPDFAGLDLCVVADGWDNQLWPLADELAVRMPRTERAPSLLRKEHQWLPALTPRLPLPVPTPLRIGEPSARFPRPWTIATWVPGEPADRAPISNDSAADTLADEAVAAPDGEDPPVWLHGDLHPAHVVVSDGALAGVIDFGDMCAGDPAVDLAAARVLGPTRHRLRGSDNRRPTSWRADCSSSVKPRQ